MPANIRLEDIPVKNFGEYMLDCMRPYKNYPALVNAETGETYTFTKVVELTERLAAGLQHIGVRKGDVICACSTNNIDYMIAFYATTLIGATFQPVNPTYTKGDLVKVTRECRSKFIFTIPAFLDKVKQAVAGSSIKIITFGQAVGFTSFRDLLYITSTRYSPVSCDPKNDVAALMSSSGTTGFPKSVMLSHYNIVSCSVLLNAMDAVQVNASVVLMLPMYHAYGLYILTANSHTMGAQVVVMGKFTPDSYLELIQKYKPDQLHVIPFVMVMLAKYPKVAQYDLSSVKKILCGAAPLSQEIEEICRKKLNLKKIDQGYGMTEIGVSHLNTDTEYRAKSVGKLVPCVEMKIVDGETLKPVGQGQEGELWVRGPQLSKGYLNLPQATAEMFLPDGWVRTGDLVVEDKDGYLYIVCRLKELIKYKGLQVAPAYLEDVLLKHSDVADCGIIFDRKKNLGGKEENAGDLVVEDKDGYLYIVGRLKELIKYKGLQVAPAYLEDVLLKHSDVADCGVIGIPDEVAGELPKAFVVKKVGKQVTAKELVDYVKGRVAPHMQLRGGAEFIDEIPRTLSGKILRRVLRQRPSPVSKL